MKSYIKISFYDNSTKTNTIASQEFSTDMITWKDLLEVFNRSVKGAGFIAPKLDDFVDSIEFENELSTQEEQTT